MQSKIKSISIKIVFVVVAIFCLMRAWDNTANKVPEIDFYQFWVVGQAITSMDVGNIYSEEARKEIGAEFYQRALRQTDSKRYYVTAYNRKVLETYSTPFLYSTFHLFASRDYEKALQRYHILSILSIFLTIMLLSRLANIPLLTTTVLLLVFMVFFYPFLSDLRIGNTNSVQIGMLALFLWLKSKDWQRWGSILGGAVIGLLIMFKPNLVFVPMILMVSMVLDRRHNEFLYWIVGFVSAAAIAFVSSSIFFGSLYCWGEWLSALSGLPGAKIDITMGNFSMVRLLFVTFGIKMAFLFTVFFVALTVIFFWLARRTNGNGGGELSVVYNKEWALAQDWRAIGAGCFIYLLSAPLVWVHYFLLAIPAAIFLLRPACSLSPLRHGFAPYRFAITAISVVGLMIIPYAKPFNIRDLRYLVIITSLSSLSFLALILMDLFLARGPQGPSEIEGADKECAERKEILKEAR